MKNFKHFKLSLLMFVTLLLSVGVFAQRGRGHYKPYKSYHRNYVSIRVAPRYNYRPAYRSYYRPAPVYRPRYRTVYRNPIAYAHFGPVFGVRINVLPIGYSRVYVGSVPYYYNQGIYYRSYNSGGYEIVAPPLGASVNRLPSNAKVTIIDGQKYYELGGTYYQEEIAENNKIFYRVVGTDGVLNTDNADQDEELNAYDEAVPSLGSRFDELPGDAKLQVINQQKYFVTASGIYYKEVIEGDKLRYEVTTVE